VSGRNGFQNSGSWFDFEDVTSSTLERRRHKHAGPANKIRCRTSTYCVHTLNTKKNLLNSLNTFTKETSSPNARVPRAQKSPSSKWTNRAPAVVRRRHEPGLRPGQTTRQTGLPHLVSQRARVRTLQSTDSVYVSVCHID
jgi:hypothetical protein